MSYYKSKLITSDHNDEKCPNGVCLLNLNGNNNEDIYHDEDLEEKNDEYLIPDNADNLEEISKIDLKLAQQLTKLRKNMLEFTEELISSFPEQSDFVLLRVFLENILHDVLMAKCIEYLLPWEKMIKARKEEFFLKREDIFSKLNKSKVSYFKDLWLSKNTTNDDKDVIWAWFKKIVSICKKYYRFSKIKERLIKKE